MTPMMKQYFSIKENYRDCILMYRLGDFYEMFYDDAVTASEILDLVLTGRDAGEGTRAPMCGVPFHSVDNYVSKLIARGKKVAICEQLNVPLKGMAERDVVRVITPGTVIEDNILDERRNNYLAVVYCEKNKSRIAVAWCDITTGDLCVSEFDGKSESQLQEFLVAIKPSEILCNTDAFYLNGRLACVKSEYVPELKIYRDVCFKYENACETITKYFSVHSVDVFEIKETPFCINAAGALIEYVSETQKRHLNNITGISLVTSNQYMSLDYNTRRNLELTQNNRDQRKKGSLLWLLDKTVTGMGARMLAKWINRPLINAEALNQRLDMVESFVDDFLLRESLYDVMGGVKDIERICGKIAYGTCMPKDFKALELSLKLIPKIKSVLSYSNTKYSKRLNSELSEFEELSTILENVISDEPPTTLRETGYIKEGYNEELDKLRRFAQDGKNMLAELEQREKAETGIKTLKVGFNKVFGYYIEVSNSFKNSVPQHYFRKQTLTNGERFITEELKELEEKLLTAGDQYAALERKLYNELCETVLPYLPKVQRIADALARIDCILSLAKVSVNNGYSKPQIVDDSDTLKIVEGRHPILEELMRTENFVANDTLLDCDKNRTIILTGPNMAGKSTYMRQIALITIMAHIGCFVSADKAIIPITDKIFTRVGANDDLMFNQSTFMVEMIEAAYILRNATEKSLIIIDELGRGTSSIDGLSIAQAVIEHINANIKAKTIFATHYFELVELEKSNSGIKNFGMAIKETDDGIVFLRKVVRGGTNKSFGIEVAQLAGIESSVITRAKEISASIEANRDKSE